MVAGLTPGGVGGGGEENGCALVLLWSTGNKTKRPQSLVQNQTKSHLIGIHWLLPETGTGAGTAGAAGTGTAGNAGAAGAGTAPLGLVKYNGAFDLFFFRLALASSANSQQKFERQTHFLVGNNDS